MTEKQLVTSPIAVKQAVEGQQKSSVYSEEALKALNIRPVKTVWGWDHLRPIYNRLPAIEEGYQIGYTEDQPRVYIDPSKNRAIGVSTMEVTRDERNFGTLHVESGTITWKEGYIDTEPLTIDTNALNQGFGLPVGFYQLVYRIVPKSEVETSPIPGHYLVEVDGEGLADAYLEFASSTQVAPYYDYYAIDEVQTTKAWRPALDGSTGGYSEGTSYSLDFGAPVRTKELVVKGESSALTTAKGALYVSDDGIKWDLQLQTESSFGQWEFDISKWYNRYVRAFFWDGRASIDNFKFTGSAYFKDRRVSEDQSIAIPIVQDLYEAIEGDHLMLATFEIRNVGSIVNLADRRQVSYHKHQPVSAWLTQFQDDSLRCLFDDITKYDELYMAPATSARHMYEELTDNTCFGLGELDLGEKFGFSRLELPKVLEAQDNSDIAPKAVDLLGEPTEDSSLTNRAYANYQLYESWSLDNGNY